MFFEHSYYFLQVHLIYIKFNLVLDLFEPNKAIFSHTSRFTKLTKVIFIRTTLVIPSKTIYSSDFCKSIFGHKWFSFIRIHSRQYFAHPINFCNFSWNLFTLCLANVLIFGHFISHVNLAKWFFQTKVHVAYSLNLNLFQWFRQLIFVYRSVFWGLKWFLVTIKHIFSQFRIPPFSEISSIPSDFL